MRRLLALTTFILLPLTSLAQSPTLGASYLGICHKKWPCEQSLQVFTAGDNSALGFLATTFGASCPCVKKAISQSKVKNIRIHLANGTCFKERGRTCGKYEPFYKETIKSVDRKLRNGSTALLIRYRRNVRQVRAIIDTAGPEVDVKLSLCLEAPFSQEARVKLLVTAFQEMNTSPKGVRYVDSVLPDGTCIPGLICERHGDPRKITFKPGEKSNGCIIDTDGFDYRKMKNKKEVIQSSEAQGCETFLWQPAFNLLGSGKGFIDPRKRTAIPTKADFEHLRQTLK